MSKKSKQAQLDKIKEEIIKQNICPDLAKSATQLVFGEGNPDAKIVFVGEAPGKKEDEQGLPFVGAAGKFLDEMLKSINMRRADVYITNVVKYRPPNNRDPYPDEKTQFLPFLKAQLAVIKPKLVVTLGRHSMEALLPVGLSISQCHGQPKRYQNQVYLPLFHPAAALYNNGLRQILMDDFARIPKVLAKL
jgi:DNA polymerase